MKERKIGNFESFDQTLELARRGREGEAFDLVGERRNRREHENSVQQ